jgi:acetylornithine deacetylase
MSIKTEIHTWIDENKQKYVKLLQKMVEQPSTQGNEKQVQELVADFLHQLNLEVDMWDLDGERLQKHPYFNATRTAFVNSPNVVGVLKGEGGGRSIILNGHVDVVPEGDHAQWDHEPYSGKVINGKIYGRGATDMKGGNTALMMVLEALQALNIRLKGDVIFQSVIEEESGGAGTLDAILKGYTADAAIIPEPTNMKIFPKQQGSKWFRLSVPGRTAHGGTRYQGVSAIDKALLVNDHLKELEKKRNEILKDPLYANNPIPVPINAGVIKGGDWPSSVPDLVQLEGRIGIAPNEKVEEVQAELEQWIEQLGEIEDWFKKHPVKVEWFGARWLPGEIDSAHPLMDSLLRNFEAVTKEAPVMEASPWGTDGGLLSQVGNIPTVVFGPGITALAHYPNEAIDIEKVFEAAKIIAATVVEWCGANEEG